MAERDPNTTFALKPGLLTTTVLQSIDAAINTELALYICLPCGTAFTASGMLAHRGRKHNGCPASARKQISENTHKVYIRKAYPDVPASRQPRIPFAGVKSVPDQFGCPQCPFAGAAVTVKKHIREDQHGQVAELMTGLTTQQLNSGASEARTHIRVEPEAGQQPNPSHRPLPDPPRAASDDGPLFSPPPSPPPIDDNGPPPPSVLDAALEFDWRDFRAKDLPNARLITPFLLRTNWHKFIHPYREHIPKLRELVAAPADNEFPMLAEVVKKYFYRSADSVERTNEVVLQHLNSADPTRTRAEIDSLKAALKDQAMDITDKCAVLHRVLLSLWHTETEAVANAPDPTMAFLALISLQPTGEFCGPKSVTNPIAKLCWGIKLTSLAEIHLLVARKVCADQLEAFKRIECFVVEHKLTAFSSLRSLTHYATSLVLNTLSLPQVVWVDREEWKEMLFLGRSISLPKLQQILGTIEDRIVDLWENRIMFGLGIHVEYGTLADNLTSTTPGYSFLDDFSNPFSDHNDRFIRELFNNPQLAKRFLYQIAGVPDLAEFEGLLMLQAEFTGGATVRGTELVSTLFRNTTLRSRNAVLSRLQVRAQDLCHAMSFSHSRGPWTQAPSNVIKLHFHAITLPALASSLPSLLPPNTNVLLVGTHPEGPHLDTSFSQGVRSTEKEFTLSSLLLPLAVVSADLGVEYRGIHVILVMQDAMANDPSLAALPARPSRPLNVPHAVLCARVPLPLFVSPIWRLHPQRRLASARILDPCIPCCRRVRQSASAPAIPEPRPSNNTPPVASLPTTPAITTKAASHDTVDIPGRVQHTHAAIRCLPAPAHLTAAFSSTPRITPPRSRPAPYSRTGRSTPTDATCAAPTHPPPPALSQRSYCAVLHVRNIIPITAILYSCLFDYFRGVWR
ncbi:hypothetical protein DFH09DRAFT_1081913 [Mycena vulgaris]|nr:hypothetical protein DFH09DRAFT_1081913 [Mycena vulgaris]